MKSGKVMATRMPRVLVEYVQEQRRETMDRERVRVKRNRLLAGGVSVGLVAGAVVGWQLGALICLAAVVLADDCTCSASKHNSIKQKASK